MAEAKTTLNAADIQKLVDQIVARFRPRKIILFGSYASGHPTADSDVDLLAVVPHPPGWRETYRIKTELQSQLPLRLQLVFMGEEEFEETQNVIGGLAYPASHAGQVLYEQNP